MCYVRWGAVPSLIVLFMSGLISCSNNPAGPSPPDIPAPVPRGDEDAELMALCLSGEMTAPEDLYSIIARDLGAIREEYGPSEPIVNQLTFRTPWVVSCVVLVFDTVTDISIRNGTYHAWDELNQTFGLTHFELSSLSHMAVLYFEGRLHPRRLAELYDKLPGVRADPNGILGDGPNIYPRKTDSGMSYLFRAAWGDCLSGCIHSEYWYFECTGSRKPAFIGHSDPGRGPKPVWLLIALMNMHLYRSF